MFIGPGILFDHKIKHQFPYAYLASDAFQHQVRAEAIKDAGNFRYEAFYISKGYDDAIGRYPPVLYHIAVIYSYLGNFEVYDSIYFITFLFSCFGILVFYLVIRAFNKNIAILSLPLSLLIFSKTPMIGFVWGHWPFLLGQFFLVALFWGFAKISLEKSFLFIGIFLGAVILSHTANLVFALFFAFLFLVMQLLNKNLSWVLIRKIIYICIIAFVLTVYYLIIFKNTWVITQPYQFALMPVWSDPGLYILDFKIIAAFIFIGAIFSMLSFKAGANTATLASFSMLLLGFGNYIGFGWRAFQIRFLWPIYLSFFFGFAAYKILRFFIKNWGTIHSVIFGLFFIFLFVGVVKMPFILQYEKFSNSGLMDDYHWSALKWLSGNAEHDSKIYFLYGDIYSQDALLRNSKRLHYQVDPDDFAKALQNKKLKRYYVSEQPGDGGGGIAVRKGLFRFEYPIQSRPPEDFFGHQDICNFDYVVLDKVSRQPVLAQYNLIIAAELLKKEYIKQVFENDAVMILKNKNIGDDCIEERSF
ncbi:hypothetical protein HYX05_02405 [Candidatus Woesearchaeota archaeon]|nr:hypothetical protein [Candidatus Woesearchaeota archaeon]